MSRAHDAERELEPMRLLDERATPDALRDALQALREQAPSPAAAARMREQIGKPPAPSTRGARWLVSLVLLGLAGVVLWSQRPAETPHAASPSRPQLAAAPPLTEAPTATKPAPASSLARIALEPAAPAAKAAAEIAEPPPEATPAVSTTVAPGRVHKRAKPVAPVLSVEPEREIERAEPLATPSPTIAPQPQAPIERVAPAPKPSAASDDAERVFADPQDEAGLLYRAKRLSTSDPDAALRLLVLHEASFPNGSFAQERDVLEIQIHERLGHAATAKRLAALFKQRYPSSMYRVSP